jgi:type VI secretion system secreted protein Hcp
MAVDMFMKIEGPPLPGEAKDDNAKGPKHTGEIGVLSWTWGMTQTGSTHDNSGSGTGKVNVQDLSFTKYTDTATPTLMDFCCRGKHFEKATLTVRKAGGQALEYLVIKMFNIIISSVSTGGGGSDERLTEHVSLNFGKFDITYTPQKPSGEPGAGVNKVYDIANNG